MFLSKFHFILVFTFLVINICAQQDPSFTKFTGDVYALDFRKVANGYGKHVYEGEKIAFISWDSINVPSRHIEEPFPDVDKDRMFGMVLYSTMTIYEKSCYDFALNSDDGSKLWIDGKLVLDNDKDHQMRLLVKKISLVPGTYKVKIWYHQAYPDQYGFIFDAKNSEGPCPEFEKKPETPKSIKFTLSSDISFDNDMYVIKESAKLKLDSIAQLIIKKQPKKINIVGHTDNTGSTEYNKNLSEKRAAAVQNYISNKTNTQVPFTSIAMGEEFPIENNDTPEGRSKNRRVEIILIR